LQRAIPFAVLAPGGQSGNFWMNLILYVSNSLKDFHETRHMTPYLPTVTV